MQKSEDKKFDQPESHADEEIGDEKEPEESENSSEREDAGEDESKEDSDQYGMSGSKNGKYNPVSITDESFREKEKELLALLQEFFPDSKLKIWNGNLIVK